MALRASSTPNLRSEGDLDSLFSEIRRDLQRLNDTNLLNERQVDKLKCFLTTSSYELTQQDEVTTTASEENPNIDEVFEEVRDKLLQLKKVEIGNQQYSKSLERLKKEKEHATQELEKIKFANQELQVQVNAVSGILSDSQQRNESLKRQNNLLTAELNKLASAHQKLQSDYNEIQRKQRGILEKMDAWYKVHQDVSIKQTQNHSKMIDLAKRIGHVKATTFFLHQLKQQVAVTFKSSSDALKHMQNLRETEAPGEKGHVLGQPSSFKNVAGCSSSGTTEDPRIGETRKNVDELVKRELDGYKEEVLKSLLALSNMGDAKSNSA